MKREDNILSDAEHLYAEDLAGKEVVLTVSQIEMEKVGGAGRDEKRFTFHFKETPKKYVPGVGVRRAIVRAVGSPDRAAIVGKRLRLFPTTCDAFGERNCPCIRFAGLAEETKGNAQ